MLATVNINVVYVIALFAAVVAVVTFVYVWCNDAYIRRKINKVDAFHGKQHADLQESIVLTLNDLDYRISERLKRSPGAMPLTTGERQPMSNESVAAFNASAVQPRKGIRKGKR